MTLQPYKPGEPIDLFFTAEIDSLNFENMDTKEILPTPSNISIPVLKLKNMHGANLPADFPYCTIPMKTVDTGEIVYLSLREIEFIPVTGYFIRSKTIIVHTTERVFYTSGISPADVTVCSHITLSSEDRLKIMLYRNELNSTYGLERSTT